MPDNIVRAKDYGLAGCHTCGMVVKLLDKTQIACPRCGCDMHYRKHDSINRTWALLISAFIMYIPANTEPMMRTTSLGQESADTILSGVIYFLTHGDWPIALVIFSASVLIPLLKMMAIAYILIMVQTGATTNKAENTRLYIIAEFMGKWSMVDIFVVALMAALIQLGAITTIQHGPAGMAFSAMVILTMFAAMSFDPKLIWDQTDE